MGGQARQESAVTKIQGTVRRKYKSVKVFVDKSVHSTAPDGGIDDEENFASHLKQKSLEERQRERMQQRQARLGRQQSMNAISRRCLASVRYTSMRQPKIVKYDSSNSIYRAEHAVLVGTGIGVTPFASILQSISHRYLEIKQSCPSCSYSWTNNLEASMFNLKKVDFIWINRDQKSFEWFVNLLSQLEMEQREHGGEMSRFLEMHMYVTSALQI